MKKLVLNEVESKILQRDGYVYIVRNGFDILVEGDKDCGYIITSINPYDKVVVKNDEFVASVGDGATEYVGSDSYAYTVVKVSDKMIDLGGGVKAHKWLDIQEDDVELLKGSVHDGTAVYQFKRGNGEIIRAYFHKPSNNYRTGKRILKINENGFEYVDSGRTDKYQSIVKVGYREKYRDPHF